MKENQKYLPKYWVVHDKNTDDIFVETCSKFYAKAEDKWLNKCAFSYFGKTVSDAELENMYYESDNLEVILVEINVVEKI